MEKKRLSHIVHHYFRQLEKYSKKMKDEFDEETIHNLRVNYKKLRSFLRMLRLRAAQPAELKFSHSLKKLYAAAGKIRDRQLCLKRVKETSKTLARQKTNELKKEIKDLGHKDDFPGKKELQALEENMIDHLPSASITLPRDFISQKLETVRGIQARGTYNDTELHTIRKCLKDIFYIIAIYKDDLRIHLPFTLWNDQETKKVEEFLQKLGGFNDTVIALSFVPLAEMRKAGQQEKEDLQAMRRQWLFEKRKSKRDITQELPGIKLNFGPRDRLRVANHKPG
jgi:CHAD domain-containing protein